MLTYLQFVGTDSFYGFLARHGREPFSDRACGELYCPDFGEYRDRWQFVEVPAGTQVYLEVNYEYNVPLIGALIEDLLRKKMQQNTAVMLAALKEEAESAGEE